MESTGSYWKPVYNLLEGTFELSVVNAQHMKAVPGRKTDVKDAEWTADLLRHGLLRPSFIPAGAGAERANALPDLERSEDYHDLGSNYFDERQDEQVKKRLTRRLEALGFRVHLEATV